MKRIGLMRVIAMLLCAALCLTGMAAVALADATPGEATKFSAKAVGGENQIDVTISGASNLPLKVSVLDAQGNLVVPAQKRTGNGSVVVEGVPAGTFSVLVNYADATDAAKAVKITNVSVIAAEQTPSQEPVQEPAGETTTEPSAESSAQTSTETSAEATAPSGEQTEETTTSASSDSGESSSGGTDETNATNPSTESSTAPSGDSSDTPSSESGESSTEPTTEPTDPSTPELEQIEMTVTANGDTVTVKVIKASEQAVVVSLLQSGSVKEEKTIAAGTGTVTFSGVGAGSYSVKAAYASDPDSGVTTEETVTVAGQAAPIAITSVTAGENQLVIAGTAQPNTKVTFSTNPASISAVIDVPASGEFTVVLSVPAGTYTAVYAQYGSDADSRVTKEGSFVVTAPATKPELTVDPITTASVTVFAKTTPGVVVVISTSDYNQSVTADSRGILRFSLPHTYAKGTKVTFTVNYGNGQSFTQTVTVTDAIQYDLLKKGSVSDQVYNVTKRLSELGYPISPTRTYNDSVVAAVRLFQAANGLAVDGMAGKLTQAALFSVAAIGYGEGTVYPTFVRGDRGTALIYALQQRLKDLGYYTIRVDGIFGSGTERAVREFQLTNGLTVTGKADNATQQLLYSSAAKPAGWYGGGYYGSLSRSSRYQAAVVPLQRRLKELGYYSGNIDGYFGSQTQRAVRNFQSRNGISVTGVADTYTQEVLYSSAAVAAGGGSSSSSGYRLLYWGCKGDAVRKLQQALLDAGYKQVRVVDGIFGKWTYDGVRAYQKDHGLAVDGIAGRNTQNSLYGTNY